MLADLPDTIQRKKSGAGGTIDDSIFGFNTVKGIKGNVVATVRLGIDTGKELIFFHDKGSLKSLSVVQRHRNSHYKGEWFLIELVQRQREREEDLSKSLIKKP